LFGLRGTKMRFFLKVIILTALMLVILKSTNPLLGKKNPLIGQQAPDFTLETLSGKEINMTQYRDGQPAMIFFWATWCPHCRVQLRELSLQQEQIEGKGIKIILVDVGEGLPKVRSYMEANNISFDIFFDTNTELASEYQIVGVPTFFFIDKDGIIVSAENILTNQYEKILLSLAS